MYKIFGLTTGFLLSFSVSLFGLEFPDKDYIDFAIRIADSVKLGNGSALTFAIDKEELLERVRTGRKGEQELPKEALEGIRYGLKTSFKFGEEVVKSMGQKGYYNFVKFYRKGEEPHVVFRLLGDGGLNYHDFEIIEKNGQFKFSDCYILITGENISQTMRTIMFSLLPSQDPASDKEYLQGIFRMTQVKGHLANQEYQEALEIFETIDSKQRRDKLFRLVELKIMVNLDEKKYLKLLEEYDREYPEDPSANLMMLDVYYLKGNYANVRKCLNVLEENYGEDPVIYFYYGNIAFTEGIYPMAIENYKKAIAKYSDFEDAYSGWLNCATINLDYKESFKIAAILINDFNYTKEDLKLYYEGYPDFIESKEYKKWEKK